MTECEFFQATTSSCLREVVARIRSIERGFLNVCHNHKSEQKQRDQQMMRKEADRIQHEQMWRILEQLFLPPNQDDRLFHRHCATYPECIYHG